MMRWLFTKVYSRLDTYMIGFVAVLLAKGDWGVAVVLLLAGGVFCAIFEDRYK